MYYFRVKIFFVFIFKGWEEIVDAAVSNLLRTTLSKTSKDQLTSQQQLKIPTDVLKLEKHIKTMSERIEKGTMLVHGVTRKPGIIVVYIITPTNNAYY